MRYLGRNNSSCGLCTDNLKNYDRKHFFNGTLKRLNMRKIYMKLKSRNGRERGRWKRKRKSKKSAVNYVWQVHLSIKVSFRAILLSHLLNIIFHCLMRPFKELSYDLRLLNWRINIDWIIAWSKIYCQTVCMWYLWKTIKTWTILVSKSWFKSRQLVHSNNISIIKCFQCNIALSIKSVFFK